MRMLRNFSFLLLGCAALSACGGASNKNFADCAPKDALKWVNNNPDAQSGALKKIEKSANIYVDGSGSMIGYIDGGSFNEKPFVDIISSVPQTLSQNGFKTQFFSFGTNVHGPIKNGVASLQNRNFYNCKSDGVKCDNDKTNLEIVFDKIANDDKGLSVIISDLWFDDKDNPTTGLVALEPHIYKILQTGRAIGIYGISSPFKGTIYGVPSADGSLRNVEYNGHHPLYMVVVGSPSELGKFYDSFKNSGSNYLANNMSNGAIKYNMFALSPSNPSAKTVEKLSKGNDPRVMENVFEPTEGVNIQQFIMQFKAPPANAAIEEPKWSGPSENVFYKGALWQGQLEGQTVIRKRLNNKCKGETRGWLPPIIVKNGWNNEGDKLSAELDPKNLIGNMGHKGVYMVSFEIVRKNLTPNNPQTEWTRGEWNLDPKKFSYPNKSNMFPTLYLSEFSRLMEDTLGEAVQKEQAPITGTSFMVNVK